VQNLKIPVPPETEWSMSVLLQSMATGKYVVDVGVWTVLRSQARPFGEMEALMFCYRHRLEEMRILGRRTDSQENFTISLLEIHRL